jgi:hypothetical protein
MTNPTPTGVAHVPTARNATLGDLLAILNEQQARTIDLVVPASKMRFQDGMLTVTGQDLILEDDGFTDPNGAYWPTQIFDDQVADRLDIGTAYLRRLRHGKVDKRERTTAVPRLDLWDANVNGLLQGRKPKVTTVAGPLDADGTGFRVLREAVPADSRSFFLRLLRPDNGVGVARAMLSSRFARMDNVDGLMAMLQGITDAGVDPGSLRIYGDLSETRMFVHVAAPQILAAAPALLEGYRSPFDSESERGKRTGHALSVEERIELGRQFRERGHGDGNHNGFYQPGSEPLVHAGFLLSNSEVGSGRWQIVPEITVLQCSNGLTMTKDGFARQHVGARLEEGRVEWSADTQGKELALVTAQTRDVVKAVLSAEYLETKVAELERRADGVVAEPEKTIEVVAKKFQFSNEEREGILRHFLLGGQLTSGGVMNAVTSYSQTVNNPDTAHDLNAKAIEAMEFVYATV